MQPSPLVLTPFGWRLSWTAAPTKTLEDVSATARELYLTGESGVRTLPPAKAAAPPSKRTSEYSTAATGMDALEDKDEQATEENLYADLMAETPDELNATGEAQLGCGDPETCTGLGSPASDQSASTEALPARSAAAEIGEAPNKANGDREKFQSSISGSIRNLPVVSRVVDAVKRKVLKRCKEEAEWLLPLAKAVMAPAESRVELERIWLKLIAVLQAVMTGPANSTRAARITKFRQERRHQDMLKFVTQSAVEAAASAHFRHSGADGPSPRAKRALAACYVFLEQATHYRLLTAVEDVNMVKFRYPRGALELYQDRAAVL